MNPWIIKIGGAALSHKDSVLEVAKCVAELKEHEIDVVIVHGGGPIINKKLREKNISWEFYQGQRITTIEMLSAIEEGLMEVNAEIQKNLNDVNVSNMGFNGAKDNIFQCSLMDKNLGLVGEVQKINLKSLENALHLGKVPVVAPIGFGDEGEVYNINADWGAAHLAVAFETPVLAFCTDQLGILDRNGSPYQLLKYHQLKQICDLGEVTGGMLTKCRTIDFALRHGVEEVNVLHALEISKFIKFSSIGTKCLKPNLNNDNNFISEELYESL
jgi:acetylglutamate kinase